MVDGLRDDCAEDNASYREAAAILALILPVNISQEFSQGNDGRIFLVLLLS